MGNDSSKLKGLVKEECAIEDNDFWSLVNAESPTTSNDEGRQKLSIFREAVVNGQLWVAQGPLERAIKNFMIYRHPYILKYVTTWEQGGRKHLATERVRPLAAVLSSQSDIQVCLGLRTILCSLIFLVEKAMARHLNICISSIYVTDNGSWRLAGFEYVWKTKELTKSLLDLANGHRYAIAVDPSETSCKDNTQHSNSSDYIEQYAFATLCEEILAQCSSKTDDEATPHQQEFRDYCANHLKHKNAQMRPKLSAVLLHPYFNHEFVLIHSFLFELPLKSVQQRQDFFTGLIDRLRYFSEDVVGAQLAADLLSRMVLLDPTAQLCVTPYVLRTKCDHAAALFSPATYMRHVMPHIQRMFRLRDAQIRLILLEYFMEFARLLTPQQLQELILPHLVAGMSDTNDTLVAKTLRCMADLVPILGGATVIGGQRARLFSDGRPQAAVSDATTHWVEPRSITPVLCQNGDYNIVSSGSPLPDNIDLSDSCTSLPPAEVSADSASAEMPPRLSPDGGEDNLTGGEAQLLAAVADALSAVASTAAISRNGAHVEDAEEEEEPWSDWETDELQRLNEKAPPANDVPLGDVSSAAANVVHNNRAMSEAPKSASLATAAAINDDLSALDIIVHKTAPPTTEQSIEFDFFKDMQPVIITQHHSDVDLLPTNNGDERTAKRLAEDNDDDEVRVDTSRFAAAGVDDTADATATGWGADVDVDATNWSA